VRPVSDDATLNRQRLCWPIIAASVADHHDLLVVGVA
jgi:hypothetical protein